MKKVLRRTFKRSARKRFKSWNGNSNYWFWLTDRTIEIAKKYQCRITYITKEEFTFGRSLNLGSEYATGDILIYISGHCIPINNKWLIKLIDPIINHNAGYVYGGQSGRDTTKYSEYKIFEKYFPDKSL